MNSLLNEKQIILINQNNMNNIINNNINFNPLVFPQNFVMNNMPPMNLNQFNIAPQQMMQNNVNNFENNDESLGQTINVTFVHFSGRTNLICKSNEKLSDVIKRYSERNNDFDDNLFLFNAKKLNPSSTLQECGITEGSYINVCPTKCVVFNN